MEQLKRTGLVLKPNSSRVLIRAFTPMGPQRAMKIIARIAALSETEVVSLLDQVMREFKDRHQKWRSFFLDRFEQMSQHLLTDALLSEERRLLIGAYFTQEYALESAALFNPSIIPHPNQEGLPEGALRFILSLRATGEGHISSITFRSGILGPDNQIAIDPATRFVTTPEHVPNPSYERGLFEKKIQELGLHNDLAANILDSLPEQFTMKELTEALQLMERADPATYRSHDRTVQGIISLAQSNYEVHFTSEQLLSERVLFPTAPSEIAGMEDARFVQFHDEGGQMRYYATYTAYDGKVALPQMLETEDFLHFRMSTLNGPEVQNKGFALFPRKIDGRFAMISRQDNENLYIMFSDNLHFWFHKEILLKPTYAWEFVQLGNCGSPIETEAGWLLLTHGVGAMRKYSIGAILLDKQNPTHVLGRLPEPLLAPDANEREGYVPNVVYSCGSLVHQGQLILPYAMSDYACSFATVPLDAVLNAMR